ncbi:MAG: lamin tail domain-containing protein [Planctomycetales bacterium]|nr:lamin tail domain-containing protein [Planctomycetales bacterium]
MGDLDGSNTVAIADLAVLAEQWLDPAGCTGHPDDCADLDGQGGVNAVDFSLLAKNWQREGAPVISEFMASNTNTIQDEDQQYSDWIELYNPNTTAVNPKGWHLTDNANDLNQWEFPDVTIGSGQYLLVFASGKDRRDPASELHTNFSLSGSGEYLALVEPDGSTIAYTYGVYPQQFSGISYGLGVNGGQSTTEHTLVPRASTWRYFEGLTSDPSEPDDAWRMIGFNDNPSTTNWKEGLTPIGYGDTFIETVITNPSENHSLYLRKEFVISDLSTVDSTKLDLFMDDGCIVWINGTEVTRWGVSAGNKNYNDTTGQDAYVGDADWVPVELSLPYSYLVEGTNVIAMHVLNVNAGSSDMAADADLVATENIIIDLSVINEGYIMTPSPGLDNGGVIPNPGPAVRNVTENPPRPGDAQNLVITAEVTETFNPIDTVTLHYRVMYGSETTVAMNDLGSGSDALAGDDIYTAVIPASASNPGQMVRWYITAQDNQARSSRNPLFPYPTNSAEYFGTVIADPSVNTQLPVIEWFVANVTASETDTGTRGSVYYLGQFYDNIAIHRRGGSTASVYGRVHQKFNFNAGQKFVYDPDNPKVSEFNLNHTQSDKAYVRQPLGFEAYGWCGSPGPESFPMRGQRNGQFHGVFAFIEEPEEDMLEREGLDPNGALYKMYSMFTSVGEKKTRRWEGTTDLSGFINNINNTSGTTLHNHIFDQVDLPRTLNYLAATVLVHQNDHPHKNHYLYRDSDGSGQWFFMPWDHDLTWGANWVGTSTSDLIYADDDQIAGKLSDVKPSHPFIGKEDAKEWNRNWNNLTDALLNDTTVREMFLRRLRTVMDDFLKAPGTPTNALFIEKRIDEMVALMDPDVALNYAKWANPWPWGSNYSFQDAINIVKNSYLAVRRNHLFVTHNIDRVDSYNISGSYSARIPNSQPTNPNLTFESYDYNPLSKNQDEEYLEIKNNESTAIDITGWSLAGGIEHDFVDGTVIPAGGSIYVSPNAGIFFQRTSTPKGGEGRLVQGNYNGHLSSWGETIQLLDRAGAVVDTLSYTGSPTNQQRYLRITEIMYHPAATPSDTYNEEEYEFVELKNIGATPLVLDNVKFTGGIMYTFAAGVNLTLAAGDTMVLVRNAAAFAERYNTAGMHIASGVYTGYLSNSGEAMKLEDETNSTILEFNYKDGWSVITDRNGFSLTIADPSGTLDSWDEKESWLASSVVNGTPGADETGHVAAYEAIVINEVMTHTDDLVYGDWIELHNTTGSPISIGGWFLSDDADALMQYEIAADVSIPAYGYIVFTATEHFRNASDPGCHSSFGLSEHGEQVYLCSGSGGQLAGGYCIEQDFGSADNGVTLGRYTKSAQSGYDIDFVTLVSATKGAVNSAAAVGNVVINEIMYNSPDVDFRAEYIELKNRTGSPINLFDPDNPSHTWQFTDGVEYIFPMGTIIPANGYILIVRDDPTAFRQRYETPLNIPVGVGILGPYTGKMDNTGEKLELSRPGEPDPITGIFSYIRADMVNYNDKTPWPVSADGEGNALGRINASAYGNDVINWQAASPSPGRN